MYIRRKAYSVAIDENGEEKLFSTTEIMSEESYLEKLYSESEPEQKEFASVKDLKKYVKKIYVQTTRDAKNKVSDGGKAQRAINATAKRQHVVSKKGGKILRENLDNWTKDLWGKTKY